MVLSHRVDQYYQYMTINDIYELCNNEFLPRKNGLQIHRGICQWWLKG